MKKIRIGIVGYGNLGKSVEEKLQNDERFKLVCIFSRRSVSSVLKTPCDKFENIANYKRKIDIMCLCSGSKTDIEQQAFLVSKHFHTIDTFDNHAHIKYYHHLLDEANKKNNRCSIISCGWDPGLFSLMRVLTKAIEHNCETFWGKGVSQGHSQALRALLGVDDAIEYTLPVRKALKEAQKGHELNEKSKHQRLCFVAIKKGVNKRALCQEIRSMPDYFEGYKTIIKFCSAKKIEKLKTHMYHCGCVLSPNNQMRFELNLKSNPEFTAKVMVAYCIALNKLIEEKAYGAKTILDIPLSYLLCECPAISLM